MAEILQANKNKKEKIRKNILLKYFTELILNFYCNGIAYCNCIIVME